MKSRSSTIAYRWHATATVALWSLVAMTLTAPTPATRRRAAPRRSISSERGDVPGWVMITMMTAIVVIALLTVFKDAVVDAVQNAFDSVANKGSDG